MAVLSEKVLWPVLAIFIFGIMAGFYIDDRRKMLQESSGATNKEHAGKSAEQKHAKNEHAGSAAEKEHGGKAADSKHASNEHAGKAAQSSSTSNSSTASTESHGSTSMSLKDYLAQSSMENSKQLEANVKLHQGFSGSIDEYLTGATTKPVKTQQVTTAPESSTTQSKQTHGATSMSMEEYQAKSSGHAIAQSSPQHAYHGDIEGYLAKYANGQQTPIGKQTSEPFNTKEHMGFHGSYEDYAKKYN